MNAEEFVAAWSREKSDILAEFTNPASMSQVAQRFQAMQLLDDERRKLIDVIDATLTDVFYTLLLGLDGCASIGGIQESYKIFGEDKQLIAKSGELEYLAFAAFHKASN